MTKKNLLVNFSQVSKTAGTQDLESININYSHPVIVYILRVTVKSDLQIGV